MLRRLFILCVVAEIAGDDVEVAVAVHVGGVHAEPPAGVQREIVLRLPLRERAFAVQKKPHRPPLVRQQQVLPAVAIHIAPHRAAHHAGLHAAIRVREFHRADLRVIAQQPAHRRFRIVARHAARTHEQIAVAIAIVVHRTHRPAGLAQVRQRIRRAGELTFPVIQIQPVALARIALLELRRAAGHEQIEVAVAIGIEEHRAHVLVRLVGGERIHPLRREAAVPVRQPQLARLTRAAAGEEVRVTVSIHITPHEAWSKFRHRMRQENLIRVVIIRRLAVHDLREIFRRREQRRGHRRSRRFVRRRRQRVGKAGLQISQRLRRAVRPRHRRRCDHTVLPEAKMQRRLIQRVIAALRKQLPHLPPRRRGDLHLRTIARRIPARAGKTKHHRVALRAAIAIERRRFLQIHLQQIQIAVAIKVRIGTAISDRRASETPRVRDFAKVQMLLIAIGAVLLRTRVAVLVELPEMLVVRVLGLH